MRGLQSLGAAASQVPAVARVAVNLRGLEREDVARGDVLPTVGSVRDTRILDARLDLAADDAGARQIPPQGVLHLGSAAVGARVRLLDGEVTATPTAAATRPTSAMPG